MTSDYKECCNWHGGECWITGETCKVQAGGACSFYDKYVKPPLKGSRSRSKRLSWGFHSGGCISRNNALKVPLVQEQL